MASEAIESPNVRNVQNPDVCTGKLTPGHSLCRNERALSFSGHDKDLLSKPEQLSTKSFSKRRPSGPTDWLVTLISPKPRTTDTNQSTAKRLGKADLGPHAHEKRMPTWLYNELERGAKVTVSHQIGRDGELLRVETVANETRGIIPVLAQLCEHDHTLSNVYLCHPGVQYVTKTPKEGGFCGYRNIQMMISFVQSINYGGQQWFRGRIPSILDLQVMIENAWDQGINPSGRVETGGIRGTRKYIGTSELRKNKLKQYELTCWPVAKRQYSMMIGNVPYAGNCSMH
ncbi:MAG: hypothetical protein LQ351_002356 [Letrouitia transgressa]|nr:MAG: hypothetical protein LQ351_002356 [Letrouitia transgressa]